MPYRTDIPGQVSLDQLKAIELVASLVPDNGAMVEVGSLFGLSSWAWAKSVPQSAEVYCIDPWKGNNGVRNLEAQYQVTYGLEQFKAYTADCPNIIPSPGYSPADFQDWDRKIDLYYEDAVHTDPIFSQNLEHWCGHLKPGGIVCGDDYRPRFQDIINGVAKLAKKMDRELITVDFFWCLLPRENQLEGVGVIAEHLRQLSAHSEAARRAEGAKINVGPIAPITQANASDGIEATIRTYNAGLVTWPETPDAISLGIKIFDDQGLEKASGSATIDASVLSFDLPHDAQISVDLATLPAGDYFIGYDIAQGEKWRHGDKVKKHPLTIIG